MKSHSLLFMLFLFTGCFSVSKPMPEPKQLSQEAVDAQRMITVSETTLAPVYGPLAQQIVDNYNLADNESIGIDLGSGPGSLIIELCKRTKMHWVNADINPCFFDYFMQLASKNGFDNRVSSIYADACDLPFKDNYASVIVSRGSYHFWPDKPKAFSEIYRVLKPGGVAFIGRGFATNFPIPAAKKIRNAQKKMNYDIEKAVEQLHDIMKQLGIKQYRIRVPLTGKADKINYGLWVEIRK
ncbi:MAG: class I SAM-dependent methyltransferase [Phycisphaerae bacterium]|nr:class I SAM-dependent methyltransferase [Phycisphaerae bacterium]